MQRGFYYNIIPIIFLISMFIPAIAFAECAEYKIIDHGNSTEVVCVGTPPTYEEQKKFEKEIEIREIENKVNRNKINRQLPPEDFEKCWIEMFSNMEMSGILGIDIATNIAKDLCRLSIEKKDCVVKMLKNKKTNIIGFYLMYENAVKACQY